MKSIKILFVIAFVAVINFQSNAQLKVISNGNVGIGYNAPTTKLWVEGSARFGGTTDLIIDWSGWGPTIYPEFDNSGFLGREDRRLNHIYAFVLDYWGTCTYRSDKRFKEKINGLSGVLPEIMKINAYTYHYKKEVFNGLSKADLLTHDRKRFGFIAQELNEIFPELV